MANHIVHFGRAYTQQGPSGPITTFNAGEFASFPKREAEYIVQNRIGGWAKAVRITKTILRDDAARVLGKSWESRKGVKAGQCMTLDAEDADRIIKAGVGVELIEMMTMAPHPDGKGGTREEGKFIGTYEELAAHRKAGTADEWTHPLDDLEDESEEKRKTRQ